MLKAEGILLQTDVENQESNLQGMKNWELQMNIFLQQSTLYVNSPVYNSNTAGAHESVTLLCYLQLRFGVTHKCVKTKKAIRNFHMNRQGFSFPHKRYK